MESIIASAWPAGNCLKLSVPRMNIGVEEYWAEGTYSFCE